MTTIAPTAKPRRRPLMIRPRPFMGPRLDPEAREIIHRLREQSDRENLSD